MKFSFVQKPIFTLILVGLTCGAAIAQNAAVVNGKPVSSARVDALLAQAMKGQPATAITPEIRERAKQEVINREVFMQEASQKGIAASKDVQDQIELARQSIIIGELFREYQKGIKVSKEDIQAEYDKWAKANGGKEYKAKHILVETEAQAKDVLAQLKKGAKFDQLAKKMSKDTGSAANGGDLGWSTAANYVPEFAQALVKLEKGKTTPEAVKSQFGYHIIQLDDSRPAQLPTLEQVSSQIEQELAQRKLAEYQKSLRDKAKVE